jgi:competence ComEA-like helix-hairpin-helix protein
MMRHPDEPRAERAPHAEDGAMKLRLRALYFLVLCCALFAASGALAKKTPPAKPLDLNTATAEQFAQVPGIGPATAKAIVQFRQKSGPFQRVEDLLAIRGISARKLAQIRPYLTVSKREPRRPSTSRGSEISSA